MSIENTLQNLVDSQNNLAAAMNRYASVMESIAALGPSHIITPPATNAAAATESEPAATEKATRGRKPKAEKEAPAATQTEADPFAEGGEADPFGDDEPAAPKHTAESIKALLLQVKDKNKDHALAILKKIGVSSIGQIAEKDYAQVAELAAKVLSK